ncbi:MAG: hypothetical protein WCS03_06415 [Bacteroidota bacterium]
MINQLVERTKSVVALMMEHPKQTIVDLWKKLIAYITMIQCEKESITITYQPG